MKKTIVLILCLLFLVSSSVFAAEKLDGRTAEEWFTKGTQYAKYGDHDNAIKAFSNVIFLDPERFDAYYNRGLIYAQKKHYEEAINDFTISININPQFIESYKQRGIVYFRSNISYTKSLADLNKAIEHNLGDVKTYYYRGYIYSYYGRHKKVYLENAIADYNKVISIDPKHANAYYYMAKTYEALNRNSEEAEAYRNYLQCADSDDGIRISEAKKRLAALGK